MNPGELLPRAGRIEINPGRKRLTLDVANTGDRPIQVGSHYHFAETNPALVFDREAARGQRKLRLRLRPRFSSRLQTIS